MPLAGVHGLTRAAHAGALHSRALADRPEPALKARGRDDQRRRVRRRLVRRRAGPGVFRSIEPAWNDQNLRELAGHISSHLFFAHIRAAIGSAVQQTNCHPFRHGRWLFMHNGFIDGFAAIKRDLVLAVDESLFPEIKGQTDTEVLFYLALTFGLADDPYRRQSLARSGSSRPAVDLGASSTRSRARSQPPTGKACGRSDTRARGRHGRCSSAAMSLRSGAVSRPGDLAKGV